MTFLLGITFSGGNSRAETGDVQRDTPEPSFRAISPRSDVFPEPVNSVGRCLICHQIDDYLSHPINVMPSMNVPENLPLDYGRISCLTCHDSRVEQADHQSDPSRPGLLRDNQSGATLCASCHNAASAESRNMHAISLNQAHLMRTTPGDTTDAHTWPGSLDRESSTCLSCHDGSVASDIGHQSGVSIIASRRSGKPDKSHPIGIVYENTRHDPRFAPLKPKSSLDARIRLFNNQLGCGSCHSPYSPLENLLVMSNQGSSLCLTCHDY